MNACGTSPRPHGGHGSGPRLSDDVGNGRLPARDLDRDRRALGDLGTGRRALAENSAARLVRGHARGVDRESPARAAGPSPRSRASRARSAPPRRLAAETVSVTTDRRTTCVPAPGASAKTLPAGQCSAWPPCARRGPRRLTRSTAIDCDRLITLGRRPCGALLVVVPRQQPGASRPPSTTSRRTSSHGQTSGRGVVAGAAREPPPRRPSREAARLVDDRSSSTSSRARACEIVETSAGGVPIRRQSPNLLFLEILPIRLRGANPRSRLLGLMQALSTEVIVQWHASSSFSRSHSASASP